MKRLISCLILFFSLIILGMTMDLLGVQSTIYEMLAFLVITTVWTVAIYRCFKRLSRVESNAFIVVIVSTLALSWLLRDLREGKITVFTVVIVVCAAGAIFNFLKRRK